MLKEVNKFGACKELAKEMISKDIKNYGEVRGAMYYACNVCNLLECSTESNINKLREWLEKDYRHLEM